MHGLLHRVCEQRLFQNSTQIKGSLYPKINSSKLSPFLLLHTARLIQCSVYMSAVNTSSDDLLMCTHTTTTHRCSLHTHTHTHWQLTLPLPPPTSIPHNPLSVSRFILLSSDPPYRLGRSGTYNLTSHTHTHTHTRTYIHTHTHTHTQTHTHE